MNTKYRNLGLGLAVGALTFTLVGCASSSESSPANVVAYNEASTSHYDVVKREAAAKIDGKMDDAVWKEVYDISGSFHYPWDAKEAPFTAFKAYNDGTNFYFGFEVTDSDVVQEEEFKDDESTVDVEDRVELFFAGGSVDKPGPKGMELYYGIEVDPKGRVHDYSIEYYRHFDGTWDLEGLKTAATTTDTGYVVEGLVPMKTLEDLQLIRNDIMRTGVYRAEFSTPEKEGEDPIMEWISWVDPKTEQPDYHVDSSFGEFRFLK